MVRMPVTRRSSKPSMLIGWLLRWRDRWGQCWDATGNRAVKMFQSKINPHLILLTFLPFYTRAL